MSDTPKQMSQEELENLRNVEYGPNATIGKLLGHITAQDEQIEELECIVMVMEHELKERTLVSTGIPIEMMDTITDDETEMMQPHYYGD